MQIHRYVVASLIGLMVASVAHAGRYEDYTKWAAQGSIMSVEAATYFGSEGVEEFVAVDTQPDGTIVAFGNAWGPQFVNDPKPVVLGSGRHQGLPVLQKDRKGRELVDRSNPDAAGMIVFFDSKLSKVKRVVKFDWHVASLETGRIAKNGDLLIAGRATANFLALAKGAGSYKEVAQPDEPVDTKKRRRKRAPKYGEYKYEGATVSGDVFVARMSPDASKLLWVVVLKGHREAPAKLWVDAKGNLLFESRGVNWVSVDGRQMKQVLGKSGGTVGICGVDPRDGSFFFGGDNNTNTGREPWRRPYLSKYDANGKELWAIWGWDPKRVGSDKYRLVSDSSPRVGAVDSNGDLIIGGWSDGGNSVFQRQPTDLDKGAPKSSSPLSTWGMKTANSLGWLMRIDQQTKTTKSWTNWVSYVPDTFENAKHRNAPNAASFTDVLVLDGGSVAFTGGAATGLIQTPNAFYKHPTDGRKYGGKYVAVFNQDFSDLLFSSYLPGYETAAIGQAPKGLVVAGRTAGDDGKEDPTHRSPAINAIQKEKRGAYDGHVVLLRLP